MVLLVVEATAAFESSSESGLGSEYHRTLAEPYQSNQANMHVALSKP